MKIENKIERGTQRERIRPRASAVNFNDVRPLKHKSKKRRRNMFSSLSSRAEELASISFGGETEEFCGFLFCFVFGWNGAAGCSHRRSSQYFVASISGQWSFSSLPCWSYKAFSLGQCGDCRVDNTTCVSMGENVSTRCVCVCVCVCVALRRTSPTSPTVASPPQFLAGSYRVSLALNGSVLYVPSFV